MASLLSRHHDTLPSNPAVRLPRSGRDTRGSDPPRDHAMRPTRSAARANGTNAPSRSRYGSPNAGIAPDSRTTPSIRSRANASSRQFRARKAPLAMNTIPTKSGGHKITCCDTRRVSPTRAYVRSARVREQLEDNQQRKAADRSANQSSTCPQPHPPNLPCRSAWGRDPTWAEVGRPSSASACHARSTGPVSQCSSERGCAA